jgi:hypothetical protein
VPFPWSVKRAKPGRDEALSVTGPPSGSEAETRRSRLPPSSTDGPVIGVAHAGGWFTEITSETVKAPARIAVWVLVITPTFRVPREAVEAMVILAKRLVAEFTVVELIVTPVPKTARVLPATNFVLAEPVIRTLRLLDPAEAEVTSGRLI